MMLGANVRLPWLWVEACRPARKAALLVVAVLLATACGGGGGDAFTLSIGSDFTTVLDKVTLSGSVSLPYGSERAGGTVFMPLVTCQIGANTMAWSNAANGSSGQAYALWDCEQDFASWWAPGIALAPGVNRITVSLTDSVRTAQAGITIMRN